MPDPTEEPIMQARPSPSPRTAIVLVAASVVAAGVAAWGLYQVFGILLGSVVLVPEVYWSGVIDALPYAVVAALGVLATVGAVMGARRALA